MKQYEVEMQIGPGNSDNPYGEFIKVQVMADSEKSAMLEARRVTGRGFVTAVNSSVLNYF